MRIVTEPDYIGVSSSHRLAKHFSVLSYRSGALSLLPRRLYRNWLDEDISGSKLVTLHIGHCSGFGVGSIVKHDTPEQKLRVGRFVSMGLRVRLLLNGQHETRAISTYMFSTLLGTEFQQPATPQYGDTILKNDIWIGDEAIFLGGSVIENGCVVAARALIPPNFESEPYGIYGGVPAKLIRFRFNERIRQALQSLAWWEMPLQWIRCNNTAFLKRLDKLDTEEALELLIWRVLREVCQRRTLHVNECALAAWVHHFQNEGAAIGGGDMKVVVIFPRQRTGAYLEPVEFSSELGHLVCRNRLRRSGL